MFYLGESEVLDSGIPQSTLDHACGEYKNVAVKVYAPYGFGLSELSDDYGLEEKLQEFKWDVIVISEFSRRIKDSDFDFNAITLPALNKIKSKIKNVSPLAKVLLLPNWSEYLYFEEDSSIIQSRYKALSNANRIELVEANLFWEAIFNDESKPFESRDLWAADTVNPSAIGRIVFSSLIYSHFTDEDLSLDAFDEEDEISLYLKERVNQFRE